MLLKSIIIFAICNHMKKKKKKLNINMCKVYVNYKSLFIERQCYIFMSLAQGSCAVAAFSRENRSNNMSTAEVNLVAFLEAINSIFDITNQEQ